MILPEYDNAQLFLPAVDMIILAGLLVFIIFLSIPTVTIAGVFSDHIDVGFSGSPMDYVDTDGIFLSSSSNTFSLSFSTPPDQTWALLCIAHSPSRQVVWTANRDSPISLSDKFIFSNDGNVALVLVDGSIVWSTNSSGSAGVRMQMQDSGNLVLLDAANKTLWQSFDHPTDTLLTGQIFTPETKLVSSISDTNSSSGLYSLSLQSADLQLLFGSNPIQPYWSMTQDARIVNSGTGAPSYAVLNSTGLSLVRQDSVVVSQFLWNSNASLCRAALEPDGNLHIYVYSSNVWTPQFLAVESGCSLPLFCGHYGLCNYEQCSCPLGFSPLSKNNITQGCQVPAMPACTNSSSPAVVHYEKVGDGLEYFANPFISPIKTSGLAACQRLCSRNCSCSSVFFSDDSGSCFLFSSLATIQSTSNRNYSLYVKASAHGELSPDFASPAVTARAPPYYVLLVIAGGSVLIIIAMICTFIYWFLKVRKPGEDDADDDTFLDSIPGLPTRFSFKELQIATHKFSKKLGSGGFGSVYEGVLPDKTRVAVKQLERVGQGKKEFRAEVAIIGSIHHVHLVQLRGFCAEGIHRLLVYEFMSNSSLDTCLFSDREKSHVLNWKTRYNIALGTARGLAYLHDDCRVKIIHCDIKPENILLDQDYNAKVSDFGLAKLLNKEQSQVFTTLRGTRGYLAPEWILNLAISEKSDVYSFGMVLLEIISGRKNFDPFETSEKLYFPAFAFQQAERGKLEQLVDMRLKGSACKEEVIQAVKIALWCIQEEASARPSMGKVVQMLEGTVQVPDPPLSSQLAVRLHAQMIEAINTSEQSSSVSNPNMQDLLSPIQLSAPR